MNVVEAAVAEDHYHVFRAEHWNDSVHNRVRIFLVERGPTGVCERS